MSCVLRIKGQPDPIRRFLKQTGLPEREPLSDRYRTERAANPDVLAVNIVVSGCDFDDIAGQLDDAIAFLTEFDEALRTLCHLDPFVADLDFAASITWDMFSKSVRLPPKLLALAGGIGVGIEISVYSRSTNGE